MPDLSAWRNVGASPVNGVERASDAYNRIKRQPTMVAFIRGETVLAPQEVRIEPPPSSGNVETPMGMKGKQSLNVYGYYQHFSTPDTDVKRGDRFILNNAEYLVESVGLYFGQLIISCVMTE